MDMQSYNWKTKNFLSVLDVKCCSNIDVLISQKQLQKKETCHRIDTKYLTRKIKPTTRWRETNKYKMLNVNPWQQGYIYTKALYIFTSTQSSGYLFIYCCLEFFVWLIIMRKLLPQNWRQRLVGGIKQHFETGLTE